MKKRIISTAAAFLIYLSVNACPVCEQQQPKLLRGITHGTGPESNWDWLIVGIVTAVALLTLFQSVRYLVRPGEKNSNHIKHSILSQS
ncbi:MAG TPA: hypothetical protein VK166_01770 [Chitinophagaceae bacterium]|nr:hypothetical protein [Chitinophagaceae bacterium]